MALSILITECLQNDFVKPIGPHDPLPNLLHVGFEEARRLMGEDPAEGAVGRTMRWAYEREESELALIHIRDWHDAGDPQQAGHLRQFGAHCLRDSEGARFAFPIPSVARPAPIVDSRSLNDFAGTNLEALLAPFAGRPARVGLAGVWTEAKITYLAYELRTRYPQWQLAVCSALTASSSTAQHFLALDQLEKLLEVKVFSSLGRFLDFLGPSSDRVFLPAATTSRHPETRFEGAVRLSPEDDSLLRYLFRDCRSVEFRVLDGGFSGNLVLGSRSIDLHGHEQVPHVVKIGPQELVGRERTAFERIESVLGNTAPRITEFADLEDRGAIKYRYASMGGGFSTTFQKLYMGGLEMSRLKRILSIVFGEQLGRLYAAASREKCDLLDYYGFSPRWAGSVRRKVESLVGAPADGPTLRLAEPPVEFYNPCRFYESDLPGLPRRAAGSCYQAFVHGDLNGANIIIDAQDNVWLIDFFHTHRGHILKDLIKLENDLLYIFTPVGSAGELEQALRLTDVLLSVEDLARELPSPESAGIARESFRRAYETARHLRSFYPRLIQADRDPLQLFIGQLRYAVHTLGFDESSDWQKKWALVAGGRLAERIVRLLRRRDSLRVDWLDERFTGPGKLGITLLPGRRDQGRDLARDLADLLGAGATDVVCLLALDELSRYGVESLLEEYRRARLAVFHLPVLDQSVPSRAEMAELARWIGERLAAGARVVLQCAGGLGRSGAAAACFLVSRGLRPEEAVAEVRRARSERAVESPAQEDFIRAFGRA